MSDISKVVTVKYDIAFQASDAVNYDWRWFDTVVVPTFIRPWQLVRLYTGILSCLAHEPLSSFSRYAMKLGWTLRTSLWIISNDFLIFVGNTPFPIYVWSVDSQKNRLSYAKLLWCQNFIFKPQHLIWSPWPWILVLVALLNNWVISTTFVNL